VGEEDTNLSPFKSLRIMLSPLSGHTHKGELKDGEDKSPHHGFYGFLRRVYSRRIYPYGKQRNGGVYSQRIYPCKNNRY
jgi:hypothetical protein